MITLMNYRLTRKDKSIEPFNSKAEPMTIRMVNFWKERIKYYMKEQRRLRENESEK